MIDVQHANLFSGHVYIIGYAFNIGGIHSTVLYTARNGDIQNHGYLVTGTFVMTRSYNGQLLYIFTIQGIEFAFQLYLPVGFGETLSILSDADPNYDRVTRTINHFTATTHLSNLMMTRWGTATSQLVPSNWHGGNRKRTRRTKSRKSRR